MVPNVILSMLDVFLGSWMVGYMKYWHLIVGGR